LRIENRLWININYIIQLLQLKYNNAIIFLLLIIKNIKFNAMKYLYLFGILIFLLFSTCSVNKIYEYKEEPDKPSDSEPPTITMIYPPESEILYNITPTFVWDLNANVLEYNLVISKDDNFQVEILDIYTTQKEYTLPEEYSLKNDSNNVTYFWKVRFKNEKGIWSDFYTSYFMESKRWHYYWFDTEGNDGHYLSMDIDKNDNPHILFFNDTYKILKYIYFNGINWILQEIDNCEIGFSTSITIDSNNNPHIIYQNFDNESLMLKYVHYDGNNWNYADIDYVGTVKITSSLALDNNDIPHVSYYNAGSDTINYANLNGSKWEIENIGGGGYTLGYGETNAIYIDKNDLVHLAFIDEIGVLSYAYIDDSGINTTVLPNTYASEVDINMDSTNNIIYIFYRTSIYDSLPRVTANVLSCAQYQNDEWNYETIEGYIFFTKSSTGYYISSCLNTNATPYVAFLYGGHWSGEWYTYDNLKLAYKDSSGWKRSTIDTIGYTGYYSTLKIDNYNNKHIGYCEYFDYIKGILKYAYYGWDKDY